MAWKSTGKRLRFEVFRRDKFTCNYCGRQPPDVVLELDHIVPRKEGGPDDLMNLTTSCADCNRGKAAKRLEDGVAPTPDAEMERLRMLQEAGEMRRYVKEEKGRREAEAKLIDALFDTWLERSGLDWGPNEAITASFLKKYPFRIVREAFVKVAPLVASGYVKRGAYHRYLWGTMRHMSEEAEGPEAN